ncbi:YbhN family protein [Ramlibacter sp.]|uniref:lysylphosphatidylglycerol synthase transmembrane domain-containing protein n=1 Tax=Ramlibacter sp. TaxID=1917967 RepID=UPI0035ADA6F7
MKTRRTLGIAAAGVALYIGLLVWADARNDVFGRLPQVAALLPLLAASSVLSWSLRHARWHWLLGRAGHATPRGRGFLAYLAGFAFTATPGKLGELVRIRYFGPMGVPPATVLGVFVFERALDLLVLLMLAAAGVRDARLFGFLAAFVACGLAAIVWLGRRPRHLGRPAAWLRLRRQRLPARLLRTLQRGLQACLQWVRPLDLLVGLAFGLAAWGVAIGAFVWLLGQLSVVLPAATAWAVLPTAMLAGAASMLPGGIGTTEAAIVALLALEGVAVATGLVAAVAIRLAGLWFAVVCGLAAITWLEQQAARGA